MVCNAMDILTNFCLSTRTSGLQKWSDEWVVGWVSEWVNEWVNHRVSNSKGLVTDLSRSFATFFSSPCRARGSNACVRVCKGEVGNEEERIRSMSARTSIRGANNCISLHLAVEEFFAPGSSAHHFEWELSQHLLYLLSKVTRVTTAMMHADDVG